MFWFFRYVDNLVHPYIKRRPVVVCDVPLTAANRDKTLSVRRCRLEHISLTPRVESTWPSTA